MSKSKSTITRGLAFIKTTGEPVFVIEITNNKDLFGEDVPDATVVRGVVTQDGIEHRTEEFPVEQLETSYEQVKRNAERTVLFEQQVQTLREKAEAKRYTISPGVRQAFENLQAQNPSSTKLIEEGLNG